MVCVVFAGGVEELLDPVYVVPADRDGWAEAVVWEVETETKVHFEQAFRQLPEARSVGTLLYSI